MILHYKDLTIKQIAKISNGCGGGKTALFIPNFIFEADCCHHDFYYWRGGNIFDKLKADWLFYYYMIRDVKRQKHIEPKVFYFLMATIYYIMVSVLGLPFFHFGKQRTINDIKQKNGNNNS